jgi:pyruvate carboxylase subunit B
MLRDAGFSVPDINMKAYMQVRSLTQEFIDDFLGYYINPRNRLMNSLLIAPGLPGGMMGSLMSDLENNLSSLNKWMAKNGKPEVTQDDLLIGLFDEVKEVWPMMGYPPLVTPYSQYVKNAALINVMQMMKGKQRWSLLDDNTWDMMLGKSGRVPGKLSDELVALAKDQGREFFEGDPQELYPDALDGLRKEMEENGWDTGQDDEELLEYAMHTAQYVDYKSGKAKENFEADLAKKKGAASATATTTEPKAASVPTTIAQPKSLNIDVNGEQFKVHISYGDETAFAASAATSNVTTEPVKAQVAGDFKEILAPLEGKVFCTKEGGEKAKKVGDTIKSGDVVCYIESMKVINAVKSDLSGTIAEVCFSDGEEVLDDDVLFKVQ